MRLIDADAYLYKGDLINEPTIDAEPVKHAEWVERPEFPDWEYCSNCGIGTNYKYTEERAIKAWNRRVNDDLQ